MSKNEEEVAYDLLQGKMEQLFSIIKLQDVGILSCHVAINKYLQDLHNILCPLFRTEDK